MISFFQKELYEDRKVILLSLTDLSFNKKIFYKILHMYTYNNYFIYNMQIIYNILSYIYINIYIIS